MLAVPQLSKHPRPDVFLWIEIWRVGRPIREDLDAELREGRLRWRGMQKGLAIQQDAKAPPLRELRSQQGAQAPPHDDRKLRGCERERHRYRQLLARGRGKTERLVVPITALLRVV